MDRKGQRILAFVAAWCENRELLRLANAANAGAALC